MKRLPIVVFVILFFIASCSQENAEPVGEVTADAVALPAEERAELKIIPEAVAVELPEEAEKTIRICTDTDKGIIKWEQGNVTGFDEYGQSVRLEDLCFDNNNVLEYFCDYETPSSYVFFCKSGCTEGHCI